MARGVDVEKVPLAGARKRLAEVAPVMGAVRVPPSKWNFPVPWRVRELVVRVPPERV